MVDIRAVILDFDGVVVDSESLHLRAMQQALSEVGLGLTDEAYRIRYLGLDDRNCFKAVAMDQGHSLDDESIAGIVTRKTELYGEWKDEVPIIRGAPEFIREASAKYHLGIGSGSFRHEVEYALTRAGVRALVQVIVSAEDIVDSKPAPDCYLEVLRRLNAILPEGESPLQGGDCLVVEDALHGITAAHAAGMRCVGVMSTYEAEDLKDADYVARSLAELDPESLDCEGG